MPAKYFVCPDDEKIEIAKCLEKRGCRLQDRCATLPTLRLMGFDREWRGVSPSSAGNGPRLLYLKATTDYAINPNNRVWAVFGTSTHDKLSIHDFNVLAEEKLADSQMSGIADLLEEDEYIDGSYILSDYKTWGSFKVAKAMGITSEKVDEPILDADGNLVLLRSGKNQGQPKTKQVTVISQNLSKIDMVNEELQLNRYRIFFEGKGFPISKMQIQIVSRDGGTYIAKGRGIDKNLYVIPVKRLPDSAVLDFYDILKAETDQAFKDGTAQKCNAGESWKGRRCTDQYCEVFEACQKL